MFNIIFNSFTARVTITQRIYTDGQITNALCNITSSNNIREEIIPKIEGAFKNAQMHHA